MESIKSFPFFNKNSYIFEREKEKKEIEGTLPNFTKYHSNVQTR